MKQVTGKADQEVLYVQEGNVAWIRLNRPEVYNSFNRKMLTQLQDSLDRAAGELEIRAIVLTGEGKAFCAGQDLGEFLDAGNQLPTPSDLEFGRIVDEYYTPLILKIREMDKPVLAAVNGVAAGAGANLALACDLVVALDSASFIQAFSKIGLVPDSGGTYFLPRLVGRQRAAALMLLGDQVPAPEAKEMGMIYACYPTGEFQEKVQELAGRLAGMPTTALGFIKQLLNQSESNSLEQQLHAEGLFQQRAGQTQDFAEGVSAFLEKRKAVFKGY